MKIGALTADTFKLGSSQVDKIMLGTNEVWTDGLATSPTHIQTAGAGSTGLVNSITVGSGDGWATPTSGNLLIAFVEGRLDWRSATPAGWTKYYENDVDWYAPAVFYKISDGTETSLTITRSSAADRYVNLHLIEVSDASTIVQLDDTYVLSDGALSATLTNTVADNLIVGWGWQYIGSAATYSWTDGNMVEELEIDPADVSSTALYTTPGGTVTGTTTSSTAQYRSTVLIEVGP